jgi:16S rRNA (uracil1498-N3)-methyltransferase
MSRRLHVPPAQLAEAEAAGGLLALSAEQHRYLAQVLRLRAGEPVEVFDGLGARFASVLEPAGEALALRLGARVQTEAGPVDVWLGQALAKSDKLELVIQKATELGVARVLPFSAARSVVKLDEGRGESRTERWRKIAQEAARQCGRADVPVIDKPLSLRDLLALLAAEPERRGLVLDPGTHALRLGAAARGERKLLLVIGPEGGLSPEELAACAEAGVVSVSLGALVLRTETAGLAALSIVQHLAGALG